MKKVLCFHGFGTNKDFLSFQIQQFKKEFAPIEFVTLDGPSVVPKQIITDEKLARMLEDNLIYSWSSIKTADQTDYYKSFKSGLEHAIKALKEQGPFFAIMGFSQGSHIVTLLTHLLQNGELELPYQLKCVIQVSGLAYQEVSPVKQGFYTIRSLHFIGLNDFVIERSLYLSTQFLNPLVIYHNQGHRIPVLTYEEVKQVRKFLSEEEENWQLKQAIPKL